ncbi:MAG TPA: DUF302 domain-containing protein [Draconibacterium sp.]|nr:DUF302 domain-containing protein [Draconibacterium sp.]
MKKATIIFIVGLVIGVGLTMLVNYQVFSNKMFVVKESKYGFSETIQRLEQSVAVNKWSIPHRYDLRATLEKKGFKVDSVMVFSLCKPDFANQILGSENNQSVSAIMPCRISVFEKNGKTYISMLNADLLSGFLGSEVKNVMTAATEESLKILQPIVD